LCAEYDLGFHQGKIVIFLASIKFLMSQLTHLRTFLAVYRTGSATRAALQLAMTQPAVSGHIRALETHLQRKLFTRIGRGIQPTTAADWLARAAGPYLDGIEATLMAAAMRDDQIAGMVRLGGPAEFLSEKILPELGGLSDLGIQLEVRFGVAQDTVERLHTGDLDLGIATVRIPRRSVGYEPIYREEFVLVGAPRWAAIALPGIAAHGADAIIALPWLSYGPDLPIIRRYFRDVFRAAPPNAAIQIIPDLRALMQSCAAGLGLTVLPTYLCGALIQEGALVQMHNPPQPPGNDIFLAWSRVGLRHPRNAFLQQRLIDIARRWRPVT
jgi:DNA-binding transcriptional LysR family regulator